ncbi:MAG: non-ribosomal peptide synthetase module, partial [Tissierellia bacterium]|nr:non-ribosomal peptide synthetase module [Tissierellia bacterium]
EIELTEKSRIIIQRYYMDYEYNRGILDFMYGLERERREDTDASNIQD